MFNEKCNPNIFPIIFTAILIKFTAIYANCKFKLLKIFSKYLFVGCWMFFLSCTFLFCKIFQQKKSFSKIFLSETIKASNDLLIRSALSKRMKWLKMIKMYYNVVVVVFGCSTNKLGNTIHTTMAQNIPVCVCVCVQSCLCLSKLNKFWLAKKNFSALKDDENKELFPFYFSSRSSFFLLCFIHSFKNGLLVCLPKFCRFVLMKTRDSVAYSTTLLMRCADANENGEKLGCCFFNSFQLFAMANWLNDKCTSRHLRTVLLSVFHWKNSFP